MPARAIKNDKMPVSLGPYSQATVAYGELVFIAGQAGIDPKTGDAPEDFEAQARNAFANLSTVLSAVGLTLRNVVKTTVYLADASQFPALNRLFGEYFVDSPPTRAVPIVELPKGLLISVEAIAAR